MAAMKAKNSEKSVFFVPPKNVKKDPGKVTIESSKTPNVCEHFFHKSRQGISFVFWDPP